MSSPPEPGSSALLVIDMQNGFCHARGSINRTGLPSSRLAPAIGPCAAVISAARSAAVPVIYTRYVFRADGSDVGFMGEELIPALKSEKTLLEDTWDIEVVDELQPQDGDLVIDKNRPSAFLGTTLDDDLRDRGIRNVVVCGVTTNCCVETTVRDASQRDYRTFLVDDACAEFDDRRHAVALESMGMLFAHRIKVAQLEATWQ